MNTRPPSLIPGAFEEPVLRHEHRGATIEVPADWEEESVFAAYAPGPKPQPQLLLSRLSMKADETIDTCAARKIAELARLTKDFLVDESREIAVLGVRALSFRLAYVDYANKKKLQRMMFVAMNGGIYVLSGTAGVPQAARLDRAFDRAVASLRIQGGR